MKRGVPGDKDGPGTWKNKKGMRDKNWNGNGVRPFGKDRGEGKEEDLRSGSSYRHL